MDKEYGNSCCYNCPLGGCSAVYEDDVNTDYAEIEDKVAAWAAEHPEPVYPTWHDYLHIIGVLYKKHTAGGDVTEIHWGNMMAPIPADIA